MKNITSIKLTDCFCKAIMPGMSNLIMIEKWMLLNAKYSSNSELKLNVFQTRSKIDFCPKKWCLFFFEEKNVCFLHSSHPSLKCRIESVQLESEVVHPSDLWDTNLRKSFSWHSNHRWFFSFFFWHSKLDQSWCFFWCWWLCALGGTVQFGQCRCMDRRFTVLTQQGKA